MKKALPSIILALTSYLIGSFVHASFNIETWGYDGRKTIACIYLMCAILTTVYGQWENDQKQANDGTKDSNRDS